MTKAPWTIDDARELYGVQDWGGGLFDINEKGEAVVRFNGHSVSLPDIIEGITERGLEMPVLLRIENLLDNRISALNESFRSSIEKLGYLGHYRGVFPIKVNQQCQVIEEIAAFGRRYHHGLEAGSKAELIAALAILDDKEACLICNGYKDEEFVDLGLDAVKMGHSCFFVLEVPGELDLILSRSKALGVRPQIGVRLKLSTKAGGNWSESGGDRSVFGLTSTQLIDVVDRLREEDMLDCLQLLHSHLGSQIPNIRDIRKAVREASRFYTELVKEGAPMGYLDLGGGLAVDYDGSSTNTVHSRNYTLDEYTADIVEVIMDVLNENDIPHPDIITESGRSTVAFYSLLLTNVLDFAEFAPRKERIPNEEEELPDVLLYLQEVENSLSPKTLQECFNDALFYRDDIRQRFKMGQISLRHSSMGENTFLSILRKISHILETSNAIYPEFEGLEEALADIYYVNFSIFQSLPDSWAIDQLFPIMPLHRLEEYPERQAVLADITCDCDGVIDHFIDKQDVKKTLRVHSLKEKEEYYMGIFLVGAYQETLGDLHNLFGDTNVVGIRILDGGKFQIVQEIEGDTIADVLSYVEYTPKTLLEQYRKKAETAVNEGYLTPRGRKEMVQRYSESLRGYTYYER